MHVMIRAARGRGHLSRRERLRQARAEAFSRRTPANVPAVPVTLAPGALTLIDQLVRRDRTAVSSALLAVAGIGAGEPMRHSVLARVSEAACWAQAEGAISQKRSQQIARHVVRARRDLGRTRAGARP